MTTHLGLAAARMTGEEQDIIDAPIAAMVPLIFLAAGEMWVYGLMGAVLALIIGGGGQGYRLDRRRNG